MPKAPAFAPKPAVEKLPLAVRKDIRDNFEANKEDQETQISELLGTSFKINFDPNAVWAYAPDGNTSAGSLLNRYVGGFIYTLKYFLEKFGDEGKEFFNSTVTQSELSLGVNPLGDKAQTIGAEVKDGVFWILFHHQKLGYNQDSLDENLLNALEAAPREGFSLQAKHSIEEVYNADIDDITKEIGELTGISDIILDPNFEENYKALSAGKKDDSWKGSFGTVHLAYFKGLKYQLGYQGFKDDEMLQEGLAEAIPSKTFKIRIVPKLTKGSYHQVVFEDGVAYLQTVVDKWYYNVDDMGSGLVDLL